MSHRYLNSLLRDLLSDDPWTVLGAKDSIAALGEFAEGPLVAAVNDSRFRAREVTGDIADPAPIEVLFDLLLGIESDKVPDLILPMLDASSSPLRQMFAAEVLAATGTSMAASMVESLVHAPAMRYAILRGIWRSVAAENWTERFARTLTPTLASMVRDGDRLGIDGVKCLLGLEPTAVQLLCCNDSLNTTNPNSETILFVLNARRELLPKSTLWALLDAVAPGETGVSESPDLYGSLLVAIANHGGRGGAAPGRAITSVE